MSTPILPNVHITMDNERFIVPSRIGKIIKNILRHHETIAGFKGGHMEVHFTDDAVRLKVMDVPVCDGVTVNGYLEKST